MLWQDPFEIPRSTPVMGSDHQNIYESGKVVDRPGPELSALTQSIVVLAAIWSVCELPVEILSSRTPAESAACIVGKLIWLSLTLWTLSGRRAARAVFAVCCAISTFSIATGLAVEQQFFAVGFYVSAVECALKAVAFLLIIWSAVRRIAR
ncbi:MAG: hypothetical protein WCA85_13970 [Paraburkholderia sp.]|uniref:hypothetical protein n=1 Tax=Paraburkholderia sp. TaxID=1926495 RepID=UPI003C4328CC